MSGSRGRKTGTPESIEAAAKSGDRRRALEALRDRLAASADLADVAVLAQVSGQLTRVLAELDALPVAVEVSKSDDLRQRREARRRATAGQGGVSAGGGV